MKEKKKNPERKCGGLTFLSKQEKGEGKKKELEDGKIKPFIYFYFQLQEFVRALVEFSLGDEIVFRKGLWNY